MFTKRSALALFVIAASLTIATTTSMAAPALADKEDKDHAHDGLEKADKNVHDHASDNDVTFHEGLCQGGHSTDTLDNLFGGCDSNPPITDPGNSDNHRKDK